MRKQKVFDLTTHVRDTRTGEVIRDNTYRAFVSKEYGTIYERPVGSGICYTEDGERTMTIAQVKKNIAQMKDSTPKPLTTADIETIKQDFADEYRTQVEADIRAKAEEEFNARLDDVVVARVSQVMEKLGIGAEDISDVQEEIAAGPTVSIQEPENQEPVEVQGEEKPSWIKGE